jgi:hypothetical protein
MEEITNQEIKYCPRCAKAFQCHSAAVESCHCHKTALTAGQRDYISAKYQDCLCASCLEALRLEAQEPQTKAP